MHTIKHNYFQNRFTDADNDCHLDEKCASKVCLLGSTSELIHCEIQTELCETAEAIAPHIQAIDPSFPNFIFHTYESAH